MKRTLTLIVAGLLGVVLAAQPYEPVNPNATPEAKALLADLYQTVAEGKIISALHHNQLQLPNRRARVPARPHYHADVAREPAL